MMRIEDCCQTCIHCARVLCLDAEPEAIDLAGEVTCVDCRVGEVCS